MEKIKSYKSYTMYSMSHDEMMKLRKPIMKKVFAGFSSINTQELNPNPTKAAKLNHNMENLYTLHLGIFYEKKFVGWSSGFQGHTDKFYMANSGLLKEHRNKGLYYFMLDYVLAETKRMGFLEIISKHVVVNNSIIIAKLKKDFFISGFEILPRFGLTVQLSYCHSQKLKEMYKYRAGAVLSNSIKDRIE